MNSLNSDHVFVWYNALDCMQRAKCSTSPFYDVSTEASFDFCQRNFHGSPIYATKLKVKQYGLCLVYAQDAQMFNALSISGEGKVEENGKTRRRCVESEASDPKILFFLLLQETGR